MRRLAWVAAVCAAGAAQGATEIKLGLAHGIAATQDSGDVDLGFSASMDFGAERRSLGRVLAFGASVDVDGKAEAAGSVSLDFTDRVDGRVLTFGLSHTRLQMSAFDSGQILPSATAVTLGRFAIGRVEGGPVDWTIAGVISEEKGDEREAQGRQLEAELGLVPAPGRRVALGFGHEIRTIGSARVDHDRLGFGFQVRRPAGSNEINLSFTTTPNGVRTRADFGMRRDLPGGGTLTLGLGAARAAVGSLHPVGALDLRMGLTRRTTLSIAASGGIEDDPLRGEVAELNLDLQLSTRATRRTRTGLELGAFHRDPLNGGPGDTGLRANLSLSHDLTPDWSVTAGLEHSRLTSGSLDDETRSEVSVMLERRFRARRF